VQLSRRSCSSAGCAAYIITRSTKVTEDDPAVEKGRKANNLPKARRRGGSRGGRS
jgi:hypothetical protein